MKHANLSDLRMSESSPNTKINCEMEALDSVYFESLLDYSLSTFQKHKNQINSFAFGINWDELHKWQYFVK